MEFSVALLVLPLLIAANDRAKVESPVSTFDLLIKSYCASFSIARRESNTMKFLPLLMMVGVLACQPALAAAEGNPALAQADEAAIDKLVEPTLSQLRAGRALPALNAFFGTNRLMAGKTAELQALASQINSTIEIYGPLGQCELVERRNRGSYVQIRLYVCQHESMVTRWLFTMVKTTGGWNGVNVYFDDKAFKAIGE